MGFGHKWRSWVMECVSTASMSVLINGSPSKPFKMERGLRQGDPLSPFLFVLVVDVLHRLVGEAVRSGRISPLLIEEDTIKNYKRLLRCFELMSGLSINFDKSSLIPINCEEQWIQNMCQLLGCKVLNSLPVYYLSLFKLLKAVAEKLISPQRRFLWSKDDGSNGMALVKWEVVQAPKKLGGLGVGDAMVRNTAMLFKWWWRFANVEFVARGFMTGSTILHYGQSTIKASGTIVAMSSRMLLLDTSEDMINDG
ncbi:uncharacterized protein LOC107624684 [Arachis ipaensis]|uniref:uncharacterized protein LOC107624684 n=1 Tax=Arachis ipaensis TaxID=130454 RepID=UPI0007AFA3D8|nr:uncharacterized protein LOC107624684 [Arachis ipaensis]